MTATRVNGENSPRSEEAWGRGAPGALLRSSLPTALARPLRKAVLWVKESLRWGHCLWVLSNPPSPLPQLIIRFIFLLPPLDLSPWQQFSQLHFISFSANLFFCPLLESPFPFYQSAFFCTYGAHLYPTPPPHPFSFSVSLLQLTLSLPTPVSTPSPSSFPSQVQDCSNKLESIGWTRA